MLAIVKGRPEMLNLKQMLQHYIEQRHEVIERQAQAILRMPLERLTGLERDKIEDLKGILASQDRQMQIIKDEIDEVTERFGDERRTEIVYGAEEFEIEDLIAEEDMVVTISREDYVKRLSLKA